jgi:cell division protein FtsQ
MSRTAARIAPSWRSLFVGVLALAAAVGVYLAARESSMFAVRSLRVEGAPPHVTAQVTAALQPLLGSSLLKIGPADVQRQLGGLTTVASASIDRDFPHTLRIHVVAERPLAVLRQGASAWVVSADGRVIRALDHPSLSALPRIWLSRDASVSAGTSLGDGAGLAAVAALRTVQARPIGVRVRDVKTGESELTLFLRSGLELRLGDTSNLRFKLAVARKILPQLEPPAYLDVSVPERSVAGSIPQVSG